MRAGILTLSDLKHAIETFQFRGIEDGRYYFYDGQNLLSIRNVGKKTWLKVLSKLEELGFDWKSHIYRIDRKLPRQPPNLYRVERLVTDTQQLTEAKEKAPIISVLLGLLEGWIEAAAQEPEVSFEEHGVRIEFLCQMSIRAVEEYHGILSQATRKVQND